MIIETTLARADKRGVLGLRKVGIDRATRKALKPLAKRVKEAKEKTSSQSRKMDARDLGDIKDTGLFKLRRNALREGRLKEKKDALLEKHSGKKDLEDRLKQLRSRKDIAQSERTRRVIELVTSSPYKTGEFSKKLVPSFTSRGMVGGLAVRRDIGRISWKFLMPSAEKQGTFALFQEIEARMKGGG